ncbi:MAG: DUF86 domain-containing protein [Candidatus Azobacteroides sp.]|nr:DUF86 domain-containing protein [Candidatus Azobacteroides sp.]
MREKIKDKGRLEHILESIDYIVDFVKGVNFEDFKTDMKLRFAIIKNIEIFGEASYMLSNEFREQHPEVPWRKIINSRHILVHGYYQIKLEVIWEIVQKDLLPLREQIQALYDNEL